MNFKFPASCLAIAIKLSTIPTKNEMKPKRTTGSEYASIAQFKPNNSSPIVIIVIDHLLKRFTSSPPNIILPFYGEREIFLLHKNRPLHGEFR